MLTYVLCVHAILTVCGAMFRRARRMRIEHAVYRGWIDASVICGVFLIIMGMRQLIDALYIWGGR